MSKSLGNGIDPLEVIETYGTDALRFSLTIGTTPGNDIRYMPEKLESASNFANKLWNASKFVLKHLENASNETQEKMMKNQIPENLCYEDKWILSKANYLAKEVTNHLDNYDLGIAAQKIYDFAWNEFCDWYIEMVKPRLFDKQNESMQSALWTLNKVLIIILKLLHPIMPFVTEEIYQTLYHKKESIMISNWPQYSKDLDFSEEEEQIEEIKEVIVGIRNIRTNRNVHPSKKSKLIFVTKTMKNIIEADKAMIQKLGYANEIIIQEEKKNIPQNAMSIVTKHMEVFIPFEDLVEIEAEKQRLTDEIKRLEAEVQRAEKMLANPGFVNKAPEKKVQEEKEKLAKYQTMLVATQERLEKLN